MDLNENKATWFLIIRSRDEGLKEHILSSGQNTLGREEDNDITLNDTAASAYHAEIHYDQANDTVAILDKNSTNGTFVNGKRISQQQELHHEDQIRIGYCLITIIMSQSPSLLRHISNNSSTNVTSDLILESVDHYAILLHDIGKRLVNITDLDIAFLEITELIKRMIGADECYIIMEEQFDKIGEKGIPKAFAEEIIKNKTATLFSNADVTDYNTYEETTVQIDSLIPMLLVPVMVDEQVAALIFATKPLGTANHFYKNDLQLVLAVSNQVAMSIQRSRVSSELIHTSRHDSLTELPNRASFLERLDHSITQAKTDRAFKYAVLFLDIDDFKIVNDKFGHTAGDKFLQAMAERIIHNVRKTDFISRNIVIARFGGDEFAILMNDIEEDQYAVATALRLQEKLSEPFNIDGQRIYSDVSIGVAISRLGYENPESILRDADMAMYQAKELGKSRVAVYDESKHYQFSERIRMKEALKHGAIEEETQVYYQPIVSVQKMRLAGFEALIRWHTKDRGILGPADFMDAIDTEGLIYSTDHWVIFNACRQAVEWQNRFPELKDLITSINLSAENLAHPNLFDNIKQIIKDTNMPPELLWFEITEDVATSDDEKVIEVLTQMRDMGMRISLDDFGTGYSALNYLARLPLDGLKIDHSLISMIGSSEHAKRIIEMIKALTSHLGLAVFAEGVENEEQIAFLRSLGCDYLQGFYFSKPLDFQSSTKLLAGMVKA
jgi:diguanylate cyclase (GGDEF)-like protein